MANETMQAGLRDDLRVRRSLVARWPGYRDVSSDAAQADTLLDMIRRAFPELDGGICKTDLVVISSQQRRWDVLTLSDTERVIVADQSYGSLVISLDLLVRMRSCPVEAQEAFATAVFAWASFVAGDYWRASVLAGRALTQAPQLHQLQRLMHAPRPEAASESGVGLFILLHEAAHGLVDFAETSERAGNARVIVTSALEKMLAAYEALGRDIKAGRSREGYKFGGYVPSEPEDVAHMLGQIGRFRQMVEENSEIVRELACDFLAMEGLIDLFARDHNGVGLRQLGDLLLLSQRTLYAMMMISTVRSDAMIIRDQGPIGDFSDFFAELMMRQNAAFQLAATILKMEAGREPGEAASKALRHAVSNYQGAGMERFLHHISTVHQLLRDNARWSAAQKEITSRLEAFARAEGIDPFSEDEAGFALRLVRLLPI